MTLRSVLSVLVAITTLIFLPVIAGAANINWTSVSYSARAWAGVGCALCRSDENFGPPLPVSAEASDSEGYPYFGPTTALGSSNITSSTMYVYSYALSDGYLGAEARSTASFTGTFTATHSILLFNYSLDNSYYEYGGLTVSDLTDGTTIYDPTGGYRFVALSENLSIPIIAGHEIEVRFGLSSDSYIMTSGTDTSNTTLNYSIAVVPEPISSVLFVTGGTLLAGRRYFRKRTA